MTRAASSPAAPATSVASPAVFSETRNGAVSPRNAKAVLLEKGARRRVAQCFHEGRGPFGVAGSGDDRAIIDDRRMRAGRSFGDDVHAIVTDDVGAIDETGLRVAALDERQHLAGARREHRPRRHPVPKLQRLQRLARVLADGDTAWL